MADNVTVDNGGLTDYAVSTDDAGASGQVQRTKLTYSADGSATHIPADADGLLVNLGANNDVTVTGTVTASGTVTANAGTNLNTSLLALEAGGNLAGAATSLAVIDDWDETDRAKVNIIAGQAGVTAGAGAVAANTQRVTHASDDPVTTSLQLIDDAVYTSGSGTPTKGLAALGSDGTNPRLIKTDTAGELQVDVLTVPTITVNSHAVTNAGTFATQIDGAALTSLQLIDDTVFTDDAGFTPGTSKVLGIGAQADESSTDSVDEGDIGALRMTLDRKLRTTQSPHTAGGLTTYHLVSAGSTNATNIKNAAGQVYGWYIYNSNAAARKVAFHNSGSAPTAGASIFFSIVIPPASAANVEFTSGIAFSSGIGITTVTELTDAGATGVAASDLIINIFYA